MTQVPQDILQEFVNPHATNKQSLVICISVKMYKHTQDASKLFKVVLL